MSRLNGLLRVKALREERARVELALVQARAATATRRAETQGSLVAGAGAMPSGRAPVFLAAVAARAAEVSALTEALALESIAQDDLVAARGAWGVARGEVRSVQRLVDRHAAEERREREAREQVESDDRSGAVVAARRDGRPS